MARRLTTIQRISGDSGFEPQRGQSFLPASGILVLLLRGMMKPCKRKQASHYKYVQRSRVAALVVKDTGGTWVISLSFKVLSMSSFTLMHRFGSQRLIDSVLLFMCCSINGNTINFKACPTWGRVRWSGGRRSRGWAGSTVV